MHKIVKVDPSCNSGISKLEELLNKGYDIVNTTSVHNDKEMYIIYVLKL